MSRLRHATWAEAAGSGQEGDEEAERSRQHARARAIGEQRSRRVGARGQPRPLLTRSCADLMVSAAAASKASKSSRVDLDVPRALYYLPALRPVPSANYVYTGVTLRYTP